MLSLTRGMTATSRVSLQRCFTRVARAAIAGRILSSQEREYATVLDTANLLKKSSTEGGYKIASKRIWESANVQTTEGKKNDYTSKIEFQTLTSWKMAIRLISDQGQSKLPQDTLFFCRTTKPLLRI